MLTASCAGAPTPATPLARSLALSETLAAAHALPAPLTMPHPTALPLAQALVVVPLQALLLPATAIPFAELLTARALRRVLPALTRSLLELAGSVLVHPSAALSEARTHCLG
jgi:hypothetical protein